MSSHETELDSTRDQECHWRSWVARIDAQALVSAGWVVRGIVFVEVVRCSTVRGMVRLWKRLVRLRRVVAGLIGVTRVIGMVGVPAREEVSKVDRAGVGTAVFGMEGMAEGGTNCFVLEEDKVVDVEREEGRAAVLVEEDKVEAASGKEGTVVGDREDRVDLGEEMHMLGSGEVSRMVRESERGRREGEDQRMGQKREGTGHSAGEDTPAGDRRWEEGKVVREDKVRADCEERSRGSG